MAKEILTYPNKKLKNISADVVNFDSQLHTLLDEMHETMEAYGGIGLAAIQIGVALRVLVIDIVDEEGNRMMPEPIEAINPAIIEKNGETKYKEGCLSIPEYYEDVVRFSTVKVSYRDRHGEHITIEADGLLAIAFQHEIDHLNGKLFFERLSILKRKKFDKEYLLKNRAKADQPKLGHA